MKPATSGIYRLRPPNGRVVSRKLISMNGALWVVMPCGFLGIFSSLVPLDMVEGEWIFEQ